MSSKLENDQEKRSEYSAFLPQFQQFPVSDNTIQEEMLFTSQEGRDYFANCYHYFIDLNYLESDLKA